MRRSADAMRAARKCAIGLSWEGTVGVDYKGAG